MQLRVAAAAYTRSVCSTGVPLVRGVADVAAAGGHGRAVVVAAVQAGHGAHRGGVVGAGVVHGACDPSA